MFLRGRIIGPVGLTSSYFMHFLERDADLKYEVPEAYNFVISNVPTPVVKRSITYKSSYYNYNHHGNFTTLYGTILTLQL